MTLKTLKEKLQNDQNLSVSKSSIATSIKDFNFSFKRVTLVPAARNREGNIEARYNYAIDYLALDESKIIFLDEFGVSCSMRVRSGRSLIGTSPRKTVNAIRSKNYSISAAISKSGLFYYKVLNKAFNGEEYTNFIAEVLSEMLSKELESYTLIMDNCAIHKVLSVQSLVSQSNNNLIFLPPYSPQLNAIEEFFSKWKNNVKVANSDTADELQTAISNGHLNINVEDCNGYFKNVRQHVLKAIRREEF